MREPLVLALPPKHRLAAKSRIPLSALANEAFVLPPRDVVPVFHDAILRLCREAGFVPHAPHEADHLQMIIAMGGIRRRGWTRANRRPQVHAAPCCIAHSTLRLTIWKSRSHGVKPTSHRRSPRLSWTFAEHSHNDRARAPGERVRGGRALRSRRHAALAPYMFTALIERLADSCTSVAACIAAARRCATSAFALMRRRSTTTRMTPAVASRGGGSLNLHLRVEIAHFAEYFRSRASDLGTESTAPRNL